MQTFSRLEPRLFGSVTAWPQWPILIAHSVHVLCSMPPAQYKCDMSLTGPEKGSFLGLRCRRRYRNGLWRRCRPIAGADGDSEGQVKSIVIHPPGPSSQRWWVLNGLALAFLNAGQAIATKKPSTWPGLAYWGPALPVSWPEAGPGTAPVLLTRLNSAS